MKMRLLMPMFGIAALILILMPVSSGLTATSTAAVDGRDAYDAAGCAMCHSVGAVEIVAKVKMAAMKGPDLSGYKADDFAKVASYLRKESKVEGKAHKKEFKGSDEELQAIIDWLGTLEAQE